MAKVSAEYIQHIVIQGERWDTLAWIYYADATRYQEILVANPSLRNASGQWPGVPPHGTIILIPVLSRTETLPTEAMPPWLR